MEVQDFENGRELRRLEDQIDALHEEILLKSGIIGAFALIN